MLDGLKLMGKAELSEILKQTGELPNSGTTDQMGQILQWLGRTAHISSSDPKEIERGTLFAVAKNWGLELSPSLNNDEVERSLRLKIAEDSSQYLGPAWKLACVFAAAGPAAAIEPKLDLLERAASLAVPSRKARKLLMQEWQELCKRWSDTKLALEELSLSFDSPERFEQAMSLALVIALADGRLAVEEERLFRDLCERAGLNARQTGDMLNKISSLFWDNQSKALPKSVNVNPQDEQEAALRGAELTLGTGMLEGFVLEAGDRLAGTEQEEANAPKSGWRKILGAFSGLSQYVSSKISSADYALMTRIVYLSILRQHGKYVVEAAAAEHAAELARQKKEQAAPVIMSEVGEQSTLKAQRTIVLDEYK